MNKEHTEEEFNKGKTIINKIAICAIAAGALYILGVSKGVKIGRARGRLEGYANATRDIANIMQQSVSGVRPE